MKRIGGQAMRTQSLIHKTSIAVSILMFILAYGTIGYLELGNINIGQATRRLLLYVVLILFNLSVAYLTKKGEKD